jgi:hypothetical protein
MALPANIRLGWKGLPGTNASLLRKFVNNVRKKFYWSLGLAVILVFFGEREKNYFAKSCNLAPFLQF